MGSSARAPGMRLASVCIDSEHTGVHSHTKNAYTSPQFIVSLPHARSRDIEVILFTFIYCSS